MFPLSAANRVSCSHVKNIFQDDEEDEPDFGHAASPELFLHLFVNNSGKMVDFLESMVKTKPESCGGGAYTTLLEHYLHLHDEKRDGDDLIAAQALEDKVMAFLKEHR